VVPAVRSREDVSDCVSEGKAARLFVRCGGCLRTRGERNQEVKSVSRAHGTSVLLEITQGSSLSPVFVL
jgi:hypothetical protein